MLYKKIQIYTLGIVYNDKIKTQGMKFAISRKMTDFFRPIIMECMQIQKDVGQIQTDLEGDSKKIEEEINILNEEKSKVDVNMRDLLKLLDEGNIVIDPLSVEIIDLMLDEDKKNKPSSIKKAIAGKK